MIYQLILHAPLLVSIMNKTVDEFSHKARRLLARTTKLEREIRKTLRAQKKRRAEEKRLLEAVLDRNRKALEQGVNALELQMKTFGGDEGREDRLRAALGLLEDVRELTRSTRSRRISEGTLLGLERARAKGKRVGRPPGTGKFTGRVAEMRRLHRQGLNQQEIADKLRCSQSLVSRRLSQEKSKRGGKK